MCLPVSTLCLLFSTLCYSHILYSNATQAAALLLEAGADVNSRNNKRGITPIMIAGAVGHFELLELMATHHSADVNVQVCVVRMDPFLFMDHSEKNTSICDCVCV